VLSSHSDLDLREAAASALLELGGDERAVALLVECLERDDADAAGAEEALGAWLARRAARKDEGASDLMERWLALDIRGDGGAASIEEAAARRSMRARLLRELSRMGASAAKR
jgi:hypothetical protein